jgi:hypothetical protein
MHLRAITIVWGLTLELRVGPSFVRYLKGWFKGLFLHLGRGNWLWKPSLAPPLSDIGNDYRHLVGRLEP